MADAVGAPAEVALQRLAELEQFDRPERRLDPQSRIQEAGLVADLADGIGVVGRGGGEHANPARDEAVERGLQVGATVADVGAEPEVSDARGAHQLALSPIAGKSIEAATFKSMPLAMKSCSCCPLAPDSRAISAHSHSNPSRATSRISGSEQAA